MQIIVIGAGPVGLATGILLAKQGHDIIIYEARSAIPNDPHESYPIGVNPRGLYTMNQISPELEKIVKNEGQVIDSWQIFAGTKQVAKLDSGAVFGTSRGKVNLLLLQEAQSKYADKIKILFGFKLITLNPSDKSLVFQTVGGDVTVDASNSRVLAADGVYSKVRREMEAKLPTFRSIVTPWTNEYRVLFAEPGKLFEKLDTKVHYIFGSSYTATLDNAGHQQWTSVMAAKDRDSNHDRSLILAKEASPSNVASLQSLLVKRAPWLDGMFPKEEMEKYFTRKSYRGAIVECSTCRFEEWLLLVGDAHHSVLPPTGEGINSGLEDALFLASAFQSTPQRAFQEYEQTRGPDISALLEYAMYLNDAPSFGGEIGARIVFMILEGSDKTSSISHHLFGPGSLARTPYRNIVSEWKKKKAWMLPLGRVLIYPFALLYHVLALPFTLFGYLFTQPQTVVDQTLKPPV